MFQLWTTIRTFLGSVAHECVTCLFIKHGHRHCATEDNVLKASSGHLDRRMNMYIPGWDSGLHTNPRRQDLYYMLNTSPISSSYAVIVRHNRRVCTCLTYTSSVITAVGVILSSCLERIQKGPVMATGYRLRIAAWGETSPLLHKTTMTCTKDRHSKKAPFRLGKRIARLFMVSGCLSLLRQALLGGVAKLW